MKLSIIIPVYNEKKTLKELLRRVKVVKTFRVTRETIVVDDCSTDGTREILRELKKGRPDLKIIFHRQNQGKGAAVRTGFKHATGDYALIQDADLEYNPQDIPRLLEPIIQGKTEIVYGSRLQRWPNLKRDEKRPRFLLHYFGNRFLSLITSLFYGQWLTDIGTCYKLFPLKLVKKMRFEGQGFDLEPELTSKLLKKGHRILEVPIVSTPRGYEEGKKLNTLRDGLIALKTLIKYRLFD